MKKSSPLLALSLTLLAASTLLSFGVAHAQGAFTSRAQLINEGRDQFRGWCTGCHGGYSPDDVNWLEEGKGSPTGTPPLAYSDFFMADRARAISIVMDGYSGAIMVNGLPYGGGGEHMPSWRETLSDYEIASILTYLRVVLNDSTVSSCNAGNLDLDGFATCVRTARSPSSLASDSVAVWEITNYRNGIVRVGGGSSLSAPASRSFRVVGGSGSYAFAVPAGLSDKATLRVVDAWGRTVWSTRVKAGDRAVTWNGAATNGRKAPAGLYLARFEGFRAGR